MNNYTPMIKQYLEIKEKNRDSILFFRLGDFYEMFFEDAIIASRELEIVLTQRDCGGGEKCPMCGVPYHVSDVYISKLVSKGYKVAICEQLEDPRKAKGLVKRDIIRIVTPGTIIDDSVSEKGDNNYLMSLYIDEKNIGISYCDVLEGIINFTKLRFSNLNDVRKSIENEISRINPSEIVINENKIIHNEIIENLSASNNLLFTKVDKVSIEDSKKIIQEKLNINIEESEYNDEAYIGAIASILNYIYNYQEERLQHLNNINFYEIDKFLNIDSHTIVNLEIQKNLFTGNKKGSLFDVLNKTNTSMGSRLLHNFLEMPLMEKNKILERQLIVEKIFENRKLQELLTNSLKDIYDLDRIVGKLSYGRANGRDLIALKLSISKIPNIIKDLEETNDIVLKKLAKEIDSLEDICSLIDKAIIDEPPLTITEGNLIKIGFNEDLDIIRNNKIIGKQKLIEYEKNEKEKNNIKNLKIVFNKKLGYFIDVTKGNLKNVPDYYIRKQTLTNSERFITEELENIQNLILSSENEIFDKEYEIFNNIRDIILENVDRLKNTSNILSYLDVYNSLAKVAYANDYVKPTINNIGIIDIVGGRHPVVEQSIGRSNFISNNVNIGSGFNNIQIITGPNMSGKSTYLRQVAILVIMAQIGSFVPADSANISIVDKIFTRIGASDNLYKGESTFMVEMNEVSNIITNSTKDSLLILDEVGRGTSTFDGLSIAWAIVEYISTKIKAKTLFATHYHELTELENKLDNVINLQVQIEEYKNEIIFLRKIIKGKTDKSYGIEVARLAGLPKSLTDRAKLILKNIESKNEDTDFNIMENFIEESQMDMQDIKRDEFIDSLIKIDINSLSPIEALTILNEFIEKAKDL
ncbi:DNA mismatch repair protein MutS [Miniphocaeibacter sp.]|uniref:DNA mismatch repair protein MutS n=1 Tax=Miniphocaeibacter sp. TaxID=3100973 RepID=UPI003BB1F3D2